MDAAISPQIPETNGFVFIGFVPDHVNFKTFCESYFLHFLNLQKQIKKIFCIFKPYSFSISAIMTSVVSFKVGFF
ncbi:hypothetical protein CEXT_421222 [Caerostris extrusa]|uniref:Uncharacterized protein n=1 Tax=Caerostris extrusa TaxID=172846 RepID=A0AAV4XZ90_CAEEX|nr:hypothetical protein CEXT_421222 [Caerostris extrusa]